jgi:hypothetical protein
MKDDIINLARQHGKPVQEQNAEVEYLFTLEGVNALLAAERERFALECIDLVAFHGGSIEIEAAIRARGQA